jgi:hypothetical protein
MPMPKYGLYETKRINACKIKAGNTFLLVVRLSRSIVKMQAAASVDSYLQWGIGRALRYLSACVPRSNYAIMVGPGNPSAVIQSRKFVVAFPDMDVIIVIKLKEHFDCPR